MNKQINNLLIFVVMAFMGSCASRTETYLMDFDQDVTVYLSDDEKKEIKRGEKTELPMKPFFIANSSFDTVALVPIPEKEGLVHIKIPKDSSRKSANLGSSKDLSPEMNLTTQAVVEVQQLIAEKRPDEALSRITILRTRYPKFSYLLFLEASCLFLKEDIDRAKELVSAALREFPNDTAGIAFAKQLGVRIGDSTSGDTP